MNKKFSTLLSGFLLMSAFASAQNQTVQPAGELKSGKSYFVVADVDNNGRVSDGDLYLEATDVNGNYILADVPQDAVLLLLQYLTLLLNLQ